MELFVTIFCFVEKLKTTPSPMERHPPLSLFLCSLVANEASIHHLGPFKKNKHQNEAHPHPRSPPRHAQVGNEAGGFDRRRVCAGWGLGGEKAAGEVARQGGAPSISASWELGGLVKQLEQNLG